MTYDGFLRCTALQIAANCSLAPNAMCRGKRESFLFSKLRCSFFVFSVVLSVVGVSVERTTSIFMYCVTRCESLQEHNWDDGQRLVRVKIFASFTNQVAHYFFSPGAARPPFRDRICLSICLPVCLSAVRLDHNKMSFVHISAWFLFGSEVFVAIDLFFNPIKLT